MLSQKSRTSGRVSPWLQNQSLLLESSDRSCQPSSSSARTARQSVRHHPYFPQRQSWARRFEVSYSWDDSGDSDDSDDSDDSEVEPSEQRFTPYRNKSTDTRIKPRKVLEKMEDEKKSKKGVRFSLGLVPNDDPDYPYREKSTHTRIKPWKVENQNHRRRINPARTKPTHKRNTGPS